MAIFQVKTPTGTVPVEAISSDAALDKVLGDNGSDVSSLGSFGRGITSMLPLGEQAYSGIAGAVEHKPYLQERQELGQEIAQDKEENPGARLAGQATGVIAPALLTGGALAPESLLGAVGQGAAIGGGFGAGNAIDTLASGGNGVTAVKDVALGVGTGAAGGAAAKGLSALLGKFLGGAGNKLEAEAAGNAIPHPTVAPLEEAVPGGTVTQMPSATIPMGAPSGISSLASTTPEMASEAHIPAGAANPTVTSAPADVMPSHMAQTGSMPAPSDSEMTARNLVRVLGGTARQVRNLPGKNLVQTLNSMGDIINKNSTPENQLLSLTDRFPDRMQKFVKLQNQAGKVIGDTVEKANVPPLQAMPLANTIATSMKFPNPQQSAQIEGLTKQIASYAEKDGTISFQRLQQLKTDLGDTAFHGQGDPVLQHAYHVIANAEDAELEKVAGQPGIDTAAFKKAKAAYQMTSRAIPMLRMATAKSLVNTPSLSELLSGHPISAAVKLVGEPLNMAKDVIGFKAASALGNGGAEGVLSRAGSQTLTGEKPLGALTVDINHPAMAPWKPLFQKNASIAKDPSEIEKSHAVTDFTLSQRDPTYAAAKQKIADANQ